MKNHFKTITVFAASVAAVTAFSAFMLTDHNWNLKTDGVKIQFYLPEEGTRGTIGGLDAKINFNPLDLSASSISASADVNTLDAGVDMKTNHLKTSDFFDAANHPKITFTSSKIVSSDSGFVATGSLLIRDSTHTVDIPFKFDEKDNAGTFKGKMKVYAGDYGLMKKSKSGKDLVEITIEVPVTK